MEFISGPQLDELVLDHTVVERFEKIENADYALYRQDGAHWRPVEKARKYLFDKRVKGLLRQTSFSVRFGGNEIRTGDGLSVSGEIGVRYKMLNPDVLLTQSIGLSNRISNSLSAALSSAVSKYSATGLQARKLEIITQANRELGSLMSELGIDLRIDSIALTTSVDQVVENDIVSGMAQTGQLGREAIAAQAQIQIDSLRRQQEAVDGAYAGQLVTEELVQRVSRLLPLQREQIDMEVQRIRQIEQIRVDMQRQEIDNSLYRLRQILGPQLTPEQYLHAMVLVDPAVAEGLGRVMEAQGYLTRDRMASSYFASRLSPSTLPHASPLQIGVDDASGQQLVDPVARAIEQRYPDCRGVKSERFGGAKMKYLVKFDSLTIEFVLNGPQISDVLWGSGDPPQNRWKKAFVKGQNAAEVAISQIDMIRNDLNR